MSRISPAPLAFALAFTFAAAAIALTGCPPAPACGDGAVDEGETEATCCADTGCAFGACGSDGLACADPWEGACASVGAGACSAPYACAADVTQPPAYDCEACGCTAADACYEDVCYPAAIREVERDAAVVPDNLAIADYVRVFDEMAADPAPRTMAELAAEVAAGMRADSRSTALVIGAQEGADVAGVLDALLAAIGAQPTQRLDRPNDGCAAAANAAASGLQPQTFVLAVVDDEEAGTTTCPWTGTWSRCDLPTVSDCVVRAGRLAQTVVVVDLGVTLLSVDRAMLLRAGREAQDTRGAFLDSGFAAFERSAALVQSQPGLAVGGRFARVYFENFVVLASPDARAVQIGSFRALWNHAPSQAFMIDNDINPIDCAFDDAGGGLVDVTCASGAFSLDAVIDTGNFSIVDVQQTP